MTVAARGRDTCSSSKIDAVAALLVLGIHVVNTVYRNHKAIKASSSRLNHFAYIGCYIILLATLLYTITEMFPISIDAKSVLCNAFPWTLSIGLPPCEDIDEISTYMHVYSNSSLQVRHIHSRYHTYPVLLHLYKTQQVT